MVSDSHSLVPQDVLKQAKRVLYMTHLAIGDYVYQRACLHALTTKYPHLQLDIWIDDCRNHAKSWHGSRSNTLTQWLEDEAHIHTVYPIARDRQHHRQLLQLARDTDYDVIVFIATQRTEKYARIARSISSQAFIVGSKSRPYAHFFSKRYYFSKLNDWFNIDQLTESAEALHISDKYRMRFEACFGTLATSQASLAELPIDIPSEFSDKANNLLSDISHQYQISHPTSLFINHLSTTAKRDWPWAKVTRLIIELSRQNAQLVFVLNTAPDQYKVVQALVDQDNQLANIPIVVVTADTHFFQLPAMIKACDLVLSVETAIMHLASSLQKPLFVLMRSKAKSWRPAHTKHILYSDHHVGDISVEQVLKPLSDMINQARNTGN